MRIKPNESWPNICWSNNLKRPKDRALQIMNLYNVIDIFSFLNKATFQPDRWKTFETQRLNGSHKFNLNAQQVISARFHRFVNFKECWSESKSVVIKIWCHGAILIFISSEFGYFNYKMNFVIFSEVSCSERKWIKSF